MEFVWRYQVPYSRGPEQQSPLGSIAFSPPGCHFSAITLRSAWSSCYCCSPLFLHPAAWTIVALMASKWASCLRYAPPETAPLIARPSQRAYNMQCIFSCSIKTIGVRRADRWWKWTKKGQKKAGGNGSCAGWEIGKLKIMCITWKMANKRD